MRSGKNSRNKTNSKTQEVVKQAKNMGLELSVIVPAFNLSKDLARCLDSVLAQKNVNLEVIVVDNGSTDDTGDILRTYAKKYSQIKPIYIKKNCGPSGARNAALPVAKGKYIHFCDGDDSVPSGAYEEMLRVAYEEKSDIVTGNYSRRYPSEHNVIRPFSHYQAPTGLERCFESGNTTLWNKIYKRSVIGDEQFNIGLRFQEDYLFFYKIIKKAVKISYTDASVYVYTDSYQQTNSADYENKIRNANMDCIKGVCFVWRELFSKLPEDNQALWQYAYRWNLSWYYQWSWRLLQDVYERKEAFEMLRELLIWVQESVGFCDWNQSEHASQFVEIFHVDYQTFCSISFEDYLIRLALHNHVCPRAASHEFNLKFGAMAESERDTRIAQDIEPQLEELRSTYQTKFINHRLWANHYWSILDGIINDYWRLMVNQQKKDACYTQIQMVLQEMWQKNPLCRFNQPDDIWRFQGIFGVDYAMFQTFTMSQYVMVCSFKGLSSVEYRTTAASIDIHAITSAFENGNVGLKGILCALKGWFKFKLKRKHR